MRKQYARALTVTYRNGGGADRRDGRLPATALHGHGAASLQRMRTTAAARVQRVRHVDVRHHHLLLTSADVQ